MFCSKAIFVIVSRLLHMRIVQLSPTQGRWRLCCCQLEEMLTLLIIDDQILRIVIELHYNECNMEWITMLTDCVNLNIV